MEISLPFPEPVDDAQGAEMTALIVRAAATVNNMLRESRDAVRPADLAPLVAELERFFGARQPPPEVATLLSWYRPRA